MLLSSYLHILSMLLFINDTIIFVCRPTLILVMRVNYIAPLLEGILSCGRVEVARCISF